MTARRPWLLLAGLLLAAPALWAAVQHVRQELTFGVVRRAATAHERVSYSGRASWRMSRWGPGVHVRHDSESGWTRYGWGWPRSFSTAGPSTRTPDPAGFCLDIDSLERNYRADEIGPTRFLDRPARLLALKPRHPGRPSLELTLDAETLLPLQVVTFRSDGSLYRVAAYRELEIGPQEVRERVGPGPPPSVSPEHVEEAAGFRVLEPEYLPPGFRRIDIRAWGRVVRKVSMRYSDGATVFETEQNLVPTPAQMETEFEGRMGLRGAQRMVRWVLDWRLRALASADGEEAGGRTLVRHRAWGKHRMYELRDGDLELRLTARGDLEREEILRVLRSLPAR